MALLANEATPPGIQVRPDTGADRRLLAQASSNVRVDVAADDTLLIPPSATRAIESTRRISAALIVALLVGRLDAPVPQGIRIRGMHVAGALNMEAVSFDGTIAFEQCEFDEPVLLDHARLGPVTFEDCQIPEVLAAGVTVHGALVLDGLRTTGVNLSDAEIRGRLAIGHALVGAYGVSLTCARVSGDVSFDATTLGGPLMGERLQVAGLLTCAADHGGRFAADGPVHLMQAKIEGGLRLSGAVLRSGLQASRAHIGDDINCRDAAGHSFVAFGDVDLSGARAEGDVCFTGATVNGNLLAEGLVADGGAFMLDESPTERATVRGFVRLQRSSLRCMQLSGASIGGDLQASEASVRDTAFLDDGPASSFAANGAVNLAGASLGNAFFDGAALGGSETSLELTAARVRGCLSLRWSRPPGRVTLTDAEVGTLRDDPQKWPPILELAGCAYRRLEGSTQRECDQRERGDDVEMRKRWIDHAAASSKHPSTQPYAELAAYYRRLGNDDAARTILFTAECARRTTERGFARAWSTLLWLLVGYGYKPARTLGLLLVLLVTGTVLFAHFHATGQLAPLESDGPRFVAAVYTLDRLIPVIGFGLQDAFRVTGTAQWLAYAYTAAGWLLTIAVLGGLNAALRPK